MRASVQTGDLPIALGKGETGHLSSLPKERSQVSTEEKEQADKEGAERDFPDEEPHAEDKEGEDVL